MNAWRLGFTSINHLSLGGVQFNMMLVPGLTNEVQALTNLMNWSMLTPITTTTFLNSFTDTQSPGYPCQFCRLLGQ